MMSERQGEFVGEDFEAPTRDARRVGSCQQQPLRIRSDIEPLVRDA